MVSLSLFKFNLEKYKFFWIFVFSFSSQMFAGDWILKLGPPGVGNGGPNPLSIPPVNILDYEVSYLSSGGSEISLSVVPGLLYGVRKIHASGLFAGVGGGYIISVLGSGPGGYYSLGYRSKPKPFGFEVDIKQAYGFGQGSLFAVYALRLGAVWSI